MADNFSFLFENPTPFQISIDGETQVVLPEEARRRDSSPVEATPTQPPAPQSSDPFERRRTFSIRPDDIVAVIPLTGANTPVILTTMLDDLSNHGITSGSIVVQNAQRMDLGSATEIFDANRVHDSNFDLHFSNKMIDL